MRTRKQNLQGRATEVILEPEEANHAKRQKGRRRGEAERLIAIRPPDTPPQDEDLLVQSQLHGENVIYSPRAPVETPKRDSGIGIEEPNSTLRRINGSLNAATTPALGGGPNPRTTSRPIDPEDEPRALIDSRIPFNIQKRRAETGTHAPTDDSPLQGEGQPSLRDGSDIEHPESTNAAASSESSSGDTGIRSRKRRRRGASGSPLVAVDEAPPTQPRPMTRRTNPENEALPASGGSPSTSRRSVRNHGRRASKLGAADEQCGAQTVIPPAKRRKRSRKPANAGTHATELPREVSRSARGNRVGEESEIAEGESNDEEEADEEGQQSDNGEGVNDESDQSMEQNDTYDVIVEVADERPTATAESNTTRYLSLFGHAKVLDDIFAAAESAGTQRKGEEYIKHQLRIRKGPVEKFVKAAKSTKTIYEGSGRIDELDQQHRDGLSQQIAKQLDNIEKRAVELKEGGRTDEDKIHKVQDTYAFAIPEMVYLLKAAINSHHPDTRSRARDLLELTRIMDVIIFLCEKVDKWKPRPEVHLNIVKPSRSVVLPGVRVLNGAMQAELKMRRAKARDLEMRKANQDHRRKMERDAELSELKHQRAIQQRRRRIQQQLQERFQQYQLRALRPQPGLSVPTAHAKRDQPQQRRASSFVDIDENGQPLERVHLFDRRSSHDDGPAKPWTAEEMKGLIEGLERHTGPDRFTRIFEEYGQVDQALQARDLDELFTKAQEVKTDLAADVELHPDGRVVPAWLISV